MCVCCVVTNSHKIICGEKANLQGQLLTFTIVIGRNNTSANHAHVYLPPTGLEMSLQICEIQTAGGVGAYPNVFLMCGREVLFCLTVSHEYIGVEYYLSLCYIKVDCRLTKAH